MEDSLRRAQFTDPMELSLNSAILLDCGHKAVSGERPVGKGALARMGRGGVLLHRGGGVIVSIV